MSVYDDELPERPNDKLNKVGWQIRMTEDTN